MNSVQLIGRLTRDPELRSTSGGKSVGNLRLAVDRRDRDADPVYIDVVCWNGLAETCAQYLAKGRQVGVTGRLDYREWDADDGAHRSKHEIIATDVEFLNRPKDHQDQS
jgi:single-strand DNA-binding protein